MQDKLVPAAIGGVALGVASGIPIISLANCFCCAWVIGGGVLACYLYLQKAPPAAAAPYGDAALVGLFTGVIGAFVSSVISSVITMFMPSGDALAQMLEVLGDDVPPEVQDMLATMGSGGGGCISFVIGFFFLAVIYSIFATVGSLLGTAIFHRGQPQAPSYPPQGGGTPPPPPPTT